MPVPTRSAYPVGSDLSTFLTAGGYSTTAVSALLEGYAAAGWQSIEQATGRKFLAVTGTREFDVRACIDNIVDLRDDICQITSVALDGSTLTLDTHYRLLPENADDRGYPWGMVRLSQSWPDGGDPSNWKRLVVVGKWGYSLTIPEPVWQAMLAAATLLLYPQLTHGAIGPVESWKASDGTSESYGQQAFQMHRGGYQNLVNQIVMLYRRVEL